MKTTPARISADEVNLFKALRSRADGLITTSGLRKVFAKPKKLPLRKVRAADHSVLGPMLKDLLSSHGGSDDFTDTESSDPPSATGVSDRQRRRKKVPNNGHHGATPADQPVLSWGIEQPRRPETTTVTRPERAPGHATYFRNPPEQPARTKKHGHR